METLKALVLDSVCSPITKRVYNMALDEFMVWFQAPRPRFTKATVSAWRVSLEERGRGSSSIITTMSANRKLAAEAADNGLLASELAQATSRVRRLKSTGIPVGNWLWHEQAQELLSAPDVAAIRRLHDPPRWGFQSTLAAIGFVAALVVAAMSATAGPNTKNRPQKNPKPRGPKRKASNRWHANAPRSCRLSCAAKNRATRATPIPSAALPTLSTPPAREPTRWYLL